MSGSRRAFRYVDDAGQNFSLNLDESNTEAANGSAASAAPVTYGLPRNIKPRYGLYSSADGNKVVRAIFLTTATFAAANASSTLTSDGVECTLTFKKGEVVRLYKTGDTGLIDGDNP